MVRVTRRFTRSQLPSHPYPVVPDWHREVHRALELPWPCGATGAFDDVWARTAAAVTERGLTLGRNTYGGWDDGDPGFARSVWCLIAHSRPEKVVETGVARGITSRVILEALERNGAGHLWSIDLPAMDANLHNEIAVAVPHELYGRWTYVSGTSRRRLPPLLAEIGPIDLFVHDSSHTERNVRFELHQAWGAIARGAVVADDIQQTRAFETFTADLPAGTHLVAEADDRSALFGIAVQRG